MKVLITGATGNIGGAIVRKLAGSRHVLRALVRDPAKAQLPGEVEVVRGDLTKPDDVRRAMAGADRAFQFIADDNGAAFASVAGEVGLGHVVLLSSFATVIPLPLGDENTVARHHREAEQALGAAGVPATFLRAAGFYSGIFAWTSSLGESLLRAPYLDVALPLVDPDDIAATAAALLTADTPPVGALFITGPEAITVNDQARTIGELLGRTIRTERLTDAQAIATALPAGIPDIVGKSILATASPSAAALAASGDVLAVTGHPPRTFAEWAAHRAAMFSR
jgi:uncharacterized protein YbjT (DUF2867 family)